MNIDILKFSKIAEQVYIEYILNLAQLNSFTFGQNKRTTYIYELSSFTSGQNKRATNIYKLLKPKAHTD